MRIAISGRSGCGNSTVSKMVAHMLGYHPVNYTFKSIAEERGISFEEMYRMAEQDDHWDRYLDEEQVRKAHEFKNVVLGSRLAVWKLQDADLRIYLTAAPEVRAGRIQKREGGGFEEVLRKTLERDEHDHARYMRLYGIDTNDYSFVDRVIDTDMLTPKEEARIIVELARARGAS